MAVVCMNDVLYDPMLLAHRLAYTRMTSPVVLLRMQCVYTYRVVKVMGSMNCDFHHVD